MPGVKGGPSRRRGKGAMNGGSSAKKWKSKRRGVTVFERQLTKRKNWLVGYEQGKKDRRIRKNIGLRHYHKAMKQLKESDRQLFGKGMGYRNTWSKRAFTEQDEASKPGSKEALRDRQDYNPSQSDWSLIDSFIGEEDTQPTSDKGEKKADSSIDEGMPGWARAMQGGSDPSLSEQSSMKSEITDDSGEKSSKKKSEELYHQRAQQPDSQESSAYLPSAFVSKDRKSAGKRKRKKRETLRDAIRRGKEARFERSVAEMERKKEKLRHERERNVAKDRRRQRESIMKRRTRKGQPLLHKQVQLLYGQILHQHQKEQKQKKGGQS